MTQNSTSAPVTTIRPSEGLRHVRYEIRGKLARRAHEMERQGYEIVSLEHRQSAPLGSAPRRSCAWR
ncbi:MAG: hypothetical protein WDM77_11100 [Steroidobacteraceae bacterium]